MPPESYPVKLPEFVTRIPRVWAITLCALFVAYTLAGFLLAPALVRSAILGGARESLTRVPTIEHVRVNREAVQRDSATTPTAA